MSIELDAVEAGDAGAGEVADVTGGWLVFD